MRTRLAVGLLLATVLGVGGAAAAWLAWPARPISAAACARIEPGMTLDEVEAVLGGPEGQYTADGQDWSMGMLHGGLRRVGDTRRVWIGDDGAVRVDFDPNGRVHVAQWCPRSSLWDRLRARLPF